MAIEVRAMQDAGAVLERVIVNGDLSKLTPSERVSYYRAVCESLNLNPLTKPFDYLTLNGRLTLYATKTATDQLRAIKGISVDRMDRAVEDDLCIWTAYGHDANGRADSEVGAVSIKGLQGEARANAIMKASTKAKRRLTLSLAGLGWLDEIEVASVPSAESVDVDAETGEIQRRQTLRESIADRRAAIEAPRTVTPEPVTGITEAPPPEPDLVRCTELSPYEGNGQCRLAVEHSGTHRSSTRESWA